MNDAVVKRRTDGLLFKFGMIFILLIVVTLCLSGITMYLTETTSFRAQSQERIRQVAKYLESLIISDEDNFSAYQDYFMEHYHDMEIPYAFNEYHTKEAEFRRLFDSEEGGNPSEGEHDFKNMSPELQKAFFEYYHEYWLLKFEKAKEDFSLAYAYYLTFTENGDGSYEVYYMMDGERTPREGSDGKLLHLADQYHHTPAEEPVEWKVWSTGEETDEFQEWDNDWGHTYTYYVPLKLKGKKMGLICTEIDVESFNKGILINTLRHTVRNGLILILCVIVVLMIINRIYISKIVNLARNVQIYSGDKDPNVAEVIDLDSYGRDEISVLAGNTASMIRELDDHMKNLLATNKELSETRQRASNMQALTNMDALTGIRNKTAYDQETAQINRAVSEGDTKFGIAMIDLNFLKKINDTYGHEQGNIAIKKLCHITCVIFDHSPVFRIGGDEFVVILKGHDMEFYDELEKRFDDEIELLKNDDSLEEWEKVSAAIGVAFFDPALDKDVSDVFKRADNEMYEKKKAMKAARE